MKTEAQVLAETMHDVRRMTVFYFSQFKDKDPFLRFPVGDTGAFFNSAYWIMAHLAVTENFLLLHSIGGERVSIPWARSFGIGSTGDNPADGPSMEEVLTFQKLVHAKAMEYLGSLSDEYLAQPSANGFAFGSEDSVRGVIRHAIRHEGVHTGHLSWLCRLNGVKVI
jgi:hypothetical protein